MGNDTNLHDFFQQEHSALIILFEKEFSQCKSTQDWRPLLALCEFLFEQNHHAKEEKFIFAAVKDNHKIKAGGPMCAFYFDSRMANPNLQRAIDAAKTATGLSLSPEWSAQMQEINKLNLPLAIPGEDHEAGRILLRGIEHLLSQTRTDDSNILSLFNTYIEIQKLHFAREENCFFKMCMNLISPEQWQRIFFDMSSQYQEIRLDTLNVSKT